MSAFLSDEPVTFTIPERRYCTLCSLACAHLVVTFLAFGGVWGSATILDMGVTHTFDVGVTFEADTATVPDGTGMTDTVTEVRSMSDVLEVGSMAPESLQLLVSTVSSKITAMEAGFAISMVGQLICMLQLARLMRGADKTAFTLMAPIGAALNVLGFAITLIAWATLPLTKLLTPSGTGGGTLQGVSGWQGGTWFYLISLLYAIFALIMFIRMRGGGSGGGGGGGGFQSV